MIYAARSGRRRACISRSSRPSPSAPSRSLVCLGIDYRSLADRSHLIYGVIILLLLYVLIFGAVRGGGRRWIALPLFNLQPSEFMKARPRARARPAVRRQPAPDPERARPGHRRRADGAPAAAHRPPAGSRAPPPRWCPCCSRSRSSPACG
ncbi:MAG: FtsW/RodA/SpoVE family cell cycle protein [Desulfomicrobium escambiense]|nr:FtsW/RodA/SpoVE family cell cycle protein [Desulfomicrobium escambiense]